MPYVRPDVADVLAMFAKKPRAKLSEVGVSAFRANLAALNAAQIAELLGRRHLKKG